MADRYEPFGEDLYGASAIGRSAGRPILTATGIVAIAVLALGGLYQGYRFTFRNDGPAPHYAWSTPSPPMAAPETQPAIADAAPPAAKPRVELADNDDASPSATDGAPSGPSAVAAIVPVDRTALVPQTGDAQQAVTFDAPPAPAADPPQP